MKKLLIAFAILIATQSVKAQQPQEPSTFEKHDTVKVVLYVYSDSVLLTEKKVKAYKVFEIRKGDQSGQLYSLPKRWLSQGKKPIEENRAIFNEVIFPWKEEEPTADKKPAQKQ